MKYWMIVVIGFVSVLCNSYINITLRQWWSSFEQNLLLLGKFKIRVHQGVYKPFLSQFCLFSEIFCLLLQFFTLESCYIWFTLSLEYPSAYVYSFALVKFKTWVYLGYVNPVLSHIALFLRFFLFLQFFIGIILGT